MVFFPMEKMGGNIHSGLPISSMVVTIQFGQAGSFQGTPNSSSWTFLTSLEDCWVWSSLWHSFQVFCVLEVPLCWADFGPVFIGRYLPQVNMCWLGSIFVNACFPLKFILGNQLGSSVLQWSPGKFCVPRLFLLLFLEGQRTMLHLSTSCVTTDCHFQITIHQDERRCHWNTKEMRFRAV